MNILAQAENQHVFLRMVAPMSDEARDLGLTAFTKEGGLVAPDATSIREQGVIGEVLTKGPGNVSRGTLNACTVKAGDLVLFNLYHKTNDLLLQGDGVVTCNWENVMAKLSVNDAEKSVDLTPLQGFIVCKTNEIAARKIMMGKSMIHAPYGDAQYSGNPETDDKGRPKFQAKVAVEEVVQAGPGAVVDGLWQEPSQSPGDFVMYDTSVSPVRFTMAGQTFTLVHMRHVLLTIRFAADEPTISIAH